jgi:hypothetical protein
MSPHPPPPQMSLRRISLPQMSLPRTESPPTVLILVLVLVLVLLLVLLLVLVLVLLRPCAWWARHGRPPPQAHLAGASLVASALL